jgi:hypothetical protein
MDSRELFDLVLVVVAGVVAYTETYGFADPRGTIWEIAGTLTDLDIRVYLVLGGLLGVMFVGYLVVYLPRRDAQTIRPE